MPRITDEPSNHFTRGGSGHSERTPNPYAFFQDEPFWTSLRVVIRQLLGKGGKR